VAAPVFTAQQVFARVAERTGLLGDEFASKRSLAPLAGAVCGFRGERLDGVHLSLAARIPGYKPERLLREVQERHTVVRTWGPRGVLQVIPTAELSEYLAAAEAAPRWRRFLENRSNLSPQARLRLLKRLAKEEISRDALREAFPDASLRQLILREAAQGGHILWQRGEGAGTVFGWTELVLGREVTPQRDYQELVGRYLASYGPLTAADLGGWLGVTVAAARQLMAKHVVQEVQVEGESEPLFLRPQELEELGGVRKRAGRGLVVTPPGDPLAVAYKTRWRPADAGDDAPGFAFLDTRLVARWSLSRGEVTLESLDDAATGQVEKAVGKLLETAGVEATITAGA
jgi:hypothetical protein